MDDLREILLNFNQEEIQSFKNFCQRKRLKSNRKDLQLLDFLVHKRKDKKEIFILRHYGQVNNKSKEAYFTLRKKLYAHLQDYIITKQRHEDLSGSADIMGNLSLAQFLFKQNLNKIAWKHLNKAENLAQKSNHYSLLKSIYLLQIENAFIDESINVEDLIYKKNQNDERIKTEENFLLAQAIIKRTVLNFKRDKNHQDINSLVSKTLKKFKIKEELLSSPKLSYLLLDTIRQSLACEQFHSFLPVIEYHFKNLFEGFGFDTSEQLYKIEILYMFLHTLYKERQYKKCLNFYAAYSNELQSIGKMHYYELNPKFKLLYAACLNHAGEVEKAITVIEKEKQEGLKTWSKTDKNNLYLNHIVYKYQLEEIKEVSQLILEYFDHSDAFIEKAMGKEWLLKKQIIEILIQYDLKNYDQALSRIDSLEKKNKSLFDKQTFKREQAYLSLLKNMIQKPNEIKGEMFEQLINEDFDWKPIDEEDIQAIGINSWIRSKHSGNKQYDEFLELIKG